MLEIPPPIRPLLLPPPTWDTLTRKERDYILLRRKGWEENKIKRRLYFSDRGFRKFKQRLREKLTQTT